VDATGAGAAGRETGAGRAAFGAASLGSASTFAGTSGAGSVSASPLIFLRTLTATSSGIELECVFFSVTP
jgi:hypothetical protein